jgi:hypothetical protein
MMATGEAFAYGIERLPELGAASVGVHLDATSTGTPVSPPGEIPSLVDAAGKFLPRRTPDSAASMRPEDVYLEFRRQIQRVLDAGVRVSHLDNHHNWVYFAPALFRVTARLAREFGLLLRVPFGNYTPERVKTLAGMTGLAESAILEAAESCLRIVREEGVPHTDTFWIEYTSLHRTHEALGALVAALPEGVAEVCVHPGEDTDRQKQELAILLEAAEAGTLRALGLELVGYEAVRR